MCETCDAVDAAVKRCAEPLTVLMRTMFEGVKVEHHAQISHQIVVTMMATHFTNTGVPQSLWPAVLSCMMRECQAALDSDDYDIIPVTVRANRD